jgi:hypothetical protein
MGADKELLNNKGEAARDLNEKHRLKSAPKPLSSGHVGHEPVSSGQVGMCVIC